MTEQTNNLIKDGDIMTHSEVSKLLRTSKSSIDRWEIAGNFPKRINFGNNSIRWLRSDIDKWVKDKINSKGE